MFIPLYSVILAKINPHFRDSMRRKFLVVLTLLSALTLTGVLTNASAQLNKRYIYYVGASQLSDSKYEDAIETLNVLLRVDPDAHEAYFFRGIAKYNLDDLFGAEMDFSMAIEKNPVFTEAFQNRAITRMRLGNYQDALDDFQEAIDLRPDKAGPYYSRGVTFFLSQQYELALSDFNEFVRQESRVVDGYINRGLTHLELKDTLSAMEDFNNAVRTNRYDPNGYTRRGSLHMMQKNYDSALVDFDKAISLDSTYIPPYFNRAIVYSNIQKPVKAIEDFSRVLELDSTSSLTYFNRALIRSDIGDYENALKDYNKVAEYSPNNVLVFFNRANLYSQIGDLRSAERDYTKAIELYPDFANAYLNRANVRYFLNKDELARADRDVADRKIAEYRSKLTDSTFSIYADTSRRFNKLLAFETRMPVGRNLERVDDRDEGVRMMPLFRFTFIAQDSISPLPPSQRYNCPRLDEFMAEMNLQGFVLTTEDSTIPTDSLLVMEQRLAEETAYGGDWQKLFERAVVQSMIKQYTNSVTTFGDAIAKQPTNPFLYVNRSATQSEMIDFISSIDNPYQRISIETDPSSQLKSTSTRTYDYDEAIADLNKAAKLFPDFAHIYYNRANLQALSGRLPEAYDDYTKAIELWPNFAEAYFNRGLVQIYLEDTRKGFLDVSKAGELGIAEAYAVLQRYAYVSE